MVNEDEDVLFKPDVDVRIIWNKQKYDIRLVIFYFVALMALSIVFIGISYGAEIIHQNTSTNTVEYKCGYHDTDGLCECISNHQDINTMHTYYYDWKVVDTCNDKLPCPKGSLFKTNEPFKLGDTATYEIGKVYPCSTNNECTELFSFK